MEKLEQEVVEQQVQKQVEQLVQEQVEQLDLKAHQERPGRQERPEPRGFPVA